MRISLLSWNTAFYEYDNKVNNDWILPPNDNRNADRIADTILWHCPDIIVLNEFWKNSNRPPFFDRINGEKIIEKFKAKGYICLMSDNWYRSVLIAINTNRGLEFEQDSPDVKESYLSAVISFTSENKKINRLNILGVGVPPLDKSREKHNRIIGFWEDIIIQFAENYSTKENEGTIITGDFNAFLADDVDDGKPSEYADYISKLAEVLHDSWRDKHSNLYNGNTGKGDAWTWYSSTGVGRRLDYAFVSENLIDSINAEHLHYERIENYSDHSGIYITFEV